MSACEKIKELITAGWKLIDVREPFEYSNMKISGATNVRMQEAVNLPANDKYLLYCRSGARSGLVQQQLKTRGVEAINVGGINQFVGCIE